MSVSVLNIDISYFNSIYDLFDKRGCIDCVFTDIRAIKHTQKQIVLLFSFIEHKMLD